MELYVEHHKKKFQVDLRASDRARLIFTTTCRHHGPVDILYRDLDFYGSDRSI